MNDRLNVRRATLDDLDVVAPLFDRYRQFYDKHEAAASQAFIAQRLQRDESVVLLATLEDVAAGFTQLYPSFSSVRAARVWVLNDLYVEAFARRHGVAQALLAAAAGFARGDGAVELVLETMPDNQPARTLYEAHGWQRYDDTLRYRLPLA
ncbi:MAG TPA: GNAT family N-acetyltransferase [Lysobacter sp.]